MAFCDKCGMMIPDDAQRCGVCGTVVERNMVVCGSCNQLVHPALDFCSHCGAPMKPAVQEDKTQGLFTMPMQAENEQGFTAAVQEKPAAQAQEDKTQGLFAMPAQAETEKGQDFAAPVQAEAEDADRTRMGFAQPEYSDAAGNTIFCEHCGYQTDTSMAFCQQCGAPLNREEAPVGMLTEEAPKKKKKRLKWLIPVGIVGLVVAVIGVLLAIFWPRYQVYYIKDSEVFTDGKQLTGNLVDIEDVKDEEIRLFSLIAPLKSAQSLDGRYLFYPERIKEDGTYTLCYRDVRNPDKEPVKIDTGVGSISYNLYSITRMDFVVTLDGKLVTYLKDGDLYQYAVKSGQKVKVGKDVETYNVSSDGDIYFVDEERDLYYKTTDGEKQKLSGKVEFFLGSSEDGKTVYYTREVEKEKDETGYVGTQWNLYAHDKGRTRDVIGEDVSECFLRDGVLYYTRNEEVEVSMKELVEDDAAGYSDYDEVRSLLKVGSVTGNNKVLYRYADGKATKVTDNYGGYAYGQCGKGNLMFCAQGSYQKIKLSSLRLYANAATQEDKLQQLENQLYIRIEDPEWFLYSGGKILELGVDNVEYTAYDKDVLYVLEAEDNETDENGNTIYAETGTVYKVSIAEDSINTTVYDTDVTLLPITLTGDGKLLYFKEYEFDEAKGGELYMDKKLVDSDVVVYVGYIKSSDTLLYITDLDGKEVSATLKSYRKGKCKVVAEEISDYAMQPNGDVLYLSEYDNEDYEGELYCYSGGKSELLDTGVTSLIRTGFAGMNMQMLGGAVELYGVQLEVLQLANMAQYLWHIL